MSSAGRAELDERDFGEIKVGQAVSVRVEAFRRREILGTVSFIAPIVEPPRSGSRGQRNEPGVDLLEGLDRTWPRPRSACRGNEGGRLFRAR